MVSTDIFPALARKYEGDQNASPHSLSASSSLNTFLISLEECPLSMFMYLDKSKFNSSPYLKEGDFLQIAIKVQTSGIVNYIKVIY